MQSGNEADAGSNDKNMNTGVMLQNLLTCVHTHEPLLQLLKGVTRWEAWLTEPKQVKATALKAAKT